MKSRIVQEGVVGWLLCMERKQQDKQHGKKPHSFVRSYSSVSFFFLNLFKIKPEEFSFKGNTPQYYTRMKAAERQLKKEGIDLKPLLMDTKFASIAGMCHDDIASQLKSFIAIDIGNGHTTAASIEEGKIQGIFEHHTSSLTPESLENYLKRLADGTITNEEVYNDHGHGAHVINSISKIEKVIVSGPKRELIEKTNLDWHHAAPGGDVMMTGTVGLVKTILG